MKEAGGIQVGKLGFVIKMNGLDQHHCEEGPGISGRL